MATKRRAPRTRKVGPESSLQRLVCDYLTARGIRWKRNNVGVAKYGSHFVRYGEKGEADVTAYVRHPAADDAFRILNLEFKAPDGRQRYEQKIWQSCVEASGEYYLLVKSLDQVERWLKEHREQIGIAVSTSGAK